MAIANSLGLGGVFGNNAAAQQGSGFITNSSNTSGMYQDPSRWNQEQAYRDEMLRREKYLMEEKYREEIRRYGYPVPQEAMKEEAPKKVKAVSASSFPEGYEKNLLLLLEH